MSNKPPVAIEAAAALEASMVEVKNLELLVTKIVTAVRAAAKTRASVGALLTQVQGLLENYERLPGRGAVDRILQAGIAATFRDDTEH